MKLKSVENNQIFLYACAIVTGVITGVLNTNIGSFLNPLISPLIAVLLYVMFAQIPFLKLREALSDTKYIMALLLGNFILVPGLV